MSKKLNHAGEKKQTSLKANITAHIRRLVLITLGGLGLVSCILNYTSTNATLKQTMQATVDITANGIEYRIASSKNVVAEIGTSSQLSDRMITLEDKQKIMDQRKETYDAEETGILDTDGINIFTQEDMSSCEFYKRSMAGETYVSSPMLTEDGSRTRIYVSAPLWKEGQTGTEVEGVVYIVPKEDYLDSVVGDVNVSKNGYAYMLDANGTTIAHKDHSHVLAMENTIEDSKADKSLKKIAAIEQRMVAGEQGFASYHYGGVSKIMAFAPIKGTDGWSVGVNAPKNDFMSSTYFGIFFTVLWMTVSVAIGIAIIKVLAGSIGDAVKQCAARLDLLAQGDLQSPVPEIDRNDEIGTLVESTKSITHGLKEVIGDITYVLGNMSEGNFNIDTKNDAVYIGDYATLLTSQRAIIAQLNEALRAIQDTAKQVSLGSSQLAEGAQTLATGATDQASGIEEVLATVNEVTEKVVRNAEGAAATSDNARRMGKETRESTAQMQQMMDAMGRISAKSAQISHIIGSIEDIANQTNLLSLNASIEAARAGEAGRGFAVVAGEIGQLANQSAKAVDETRALIEDTLKEVESGNVIAKDTAETLTKLVEGLEKIVVDIEAVGVECEQQSDMMQQLNVEIEQISNVVESNSAAAEETSATSEELSAEAVAMNNLTEHFQLK